MNRIDSLFATGHKNVLAVYCTAGFPRLNDTLPVLQALQQHGADLVEIGMPFSDPLADGPTIQESSAVAIRNGMRIAVLFEQLKVARRSIHLPLVLMGYLNPIIRYGVERFADAALACGLDGVVIPDLPAGEREDEYVQPFAARGIHVVRMATTRTDDHRLQSLASSSGGFLYMVSMAGVTGAAVAAGDDRWRSLAKLDGLQGGKPVLVGFGVHDHGSFTAACRHASGAIVGSAYIRALSNAADIDSATAGFMRQLRAP